MTRNHAGHNDHVRYNEARGFSYLCSDQTNLAERAIVPEQRPAFRILTMSMKGSRTYMGIHRVFKLCSQAALWRPSKDSVYITVGTTRLIKLPPDAFPHNLKPILDGMSG